MTTQTRISLSKRYIEDLLQEIPDKINAYVWEDLRLVVYSGRERREIVFSVEELTDDSQEGRERLKVKVEEVAKRKGRYNEMSSFMRQKMFSNLTRQI